MAMAESGCKNWCWQVKQLLVNTIEAPTLFSVDISNGFSVTKTVDIAKQSMCRAAKELRSEHEHKDALDIEVSCDGS